MNTQLAALLCAGVVVVAATLTGCVQQAPPAPATITSGPPPWPAPRDAISWIEAAGLPQDRLGANENQRTFALGIEVDGQPVPIPSYIGVDRRRAVQAPVHTHDDTGTVWLEGSGTETVTLAQFFQVWGVRFDERCLGATCGTLRVTADGERVEDPTGLRLSTVSRTLTVDVTG